MIYHLNHLVFEKSKRKRRVNFIVKENRATRKTVIVIGKVMAAKDDGKNSDVNWPPLLMLSTDESFPNGRFTRCD